MYSEKKKKKTWQETAMTALVKIMSGFVYSIWSTGTNLFFFITLHTNDSLSIFKPSSQAKNRKSFLSLVAPEGNNFPSAVKNFPTPSARRKLRGSLGLVNFYRRFLPHSPAVLRPLTDLLHGSQPESTALQWSPFAVEAFEEI